MRAGWREGRGEAAEAQAACQGGPECGGGWQGTRGAHLKHVPHGCDAGGVEAQRLVERRRILPSKKGRIRKRGDMRAGWREGVEKRWRRNQRAREAPIVEAAGRARAERTSNMFFMLLTLEVSRLSGWLNADAYCRVKRRA
jgi:hypothetical protein